jgi:hypothetical protein
MPERKAAVTTQPNMHAVSKGVKPLKSGALTATPTYKIQHFTDSESQDVKINNETNKLVFLPSSDSESQDVKINDEPNKLTSSDSESQDIKINDESNKLASSDSKSQDIKINNKTHK